MRTNVVGILSFFFFSSLFISIGWSHDIYVDQANGGENPDGSSGQPYPTIQAAIDASTNGDRIIVRGGTYSGDGNINLSPTNEIEIRAESYDDKPTIDLGGSSTFLSWRPTVSTNGSISTISGFIFEDGFSDDYVGSVITVKTGSLTIAKCEFLNNKGNQVGPVYLDGDDGLSNPVTTPAVVTIDSCKFQGNQANAGGAIYIASRPTRAVKIHHSSFDTNTAGAEGGAIYSNSASVEIIGCEFLSNTATTSFGGAIFSETDVEQKEVKFTISTALFSQNTALSQGGAISYVNGGALVLLDCQFTLNSVISKDEEDKQKGGAVYVEGALLAAGCEFDSNACDLDASGNGGALAIYGLAATSFIRQTTFATNVCGFGSDISVLAGTAFFNSITVKKNDGPSQIHVTGSATFSDSDFKDSVSDKLQSVMVNGEGVVSFDFYAPVDFVFEIAEVVIRDQGTIRTSSNLKISNLLMSGGKIEASTTEAPIQFSIGTSSHFSADSATGISPVIAGYNFLNEGTVTIDNDVVLTITDVFTNNNTVFLQPNSQIQGRQNLSAIDCLNYGTFHVNDTAIVHCNFLTGYSNALISLNNVGLTDIPLTISGKANFEGKLEVKLTTAAEASFEDGNDVPIFKYVYVEDQGFNFVSSSSSENDVGVKYGLTTAYLTHVSEKKSNEGLSGGEIALTVIAALIGTAILGGAIWYFMFRSTPPDSYAEVGRGSYGST